MTGQYQTIAEIEAEYNGEWVLIANPTHKWRSMEVSGGVVVLHLVDRREFLQRVGDWDCTGCRSYAVRYAGRFPEEEDEELPVEPEMARQ